MPSFVTATAVAAQQDMSSHPLAAKNLMLSTVLSAAATHTFLKWNRKYQFLMWNWYARR
jgi:hypothetical protein